jgi:cobalt-zinc-cadmium efflux system membrane fusion protein
MNGRSGVGKFVATVRLLTGRVRWAVPMAVTLAAGIAAGPGGSLAHEGHDHPPTPVVEAAKGHHLAARSIHFQVVAVPKGPELLVYVDDSEANEPVTGAAVTIARGGQSVSASERSTGTYAASANWLTAPGERSVTITVDAGGHRDQVAGDLTIEPREASSTAGPPARRNADWARGAALAGLGFGLALIALRRGRVRWGGALLVLVTAAVLWATASSGHEQARRAVVSGPTPPHRHPDGTVFLPKETQRLLDIRTTSARPGRAARVDEIFGRTVLDPNRSARVQAPRDGRIEPGPHGFPHLGQTIEKGQVLAYLVPSLGVFEESSLRQTLTQIERDMALLVPRADAIGTINPNMPQSDATAGLLQELQIQSQALTRQKEAVLASLNQKVEIEAPSAGVVTSAAAISGQVVAARDLLFEIVDRQAARVEGFSFNPVSDDDIVDATAVTEDGRTLKLAFLGRGRVLQQQAVPLLFDLREPDTQVDIGMPLRILLTGKQQRDGAPLPVGAVVRGPDNLPTVWEHTGPETFVPHVVRTLPLDSQRLLAIGDLAAGMHIVTAGATFVNQVR